ncbi:MAG: phage tail tube protein gp19 [Deltaproteobacteria bacterium]|jgi:phage tail-like protein|nr:phage tail tube protein gp19 [Deltaproteobacteria bacterium]
MPAAKRKDPYENFNFRVEIDGITQAGFSEVSVLEASVDVVEYREGNELSHVRKLPGRVKYGNVTLKWGVTNSQELYNWWKSVRDGNVIRKNMSIVLMDQQRNDVKRWNVREAWPVSYKVGPLDAKGNDVLIEELEITNEGVEQA